MSTHPDLIVSIGFVLTVAFLTYRIIRLERIMKSLGRLDPQKLQAAMAAHAKPPVEVKSEVFIGLSEAIAHGVADTLKGATS